MTVCHPTGAILTPQPMDLVLLSIKNDGITRLNKKITMEIKIYLHLRAHLLCLNLPEGYCVLTGQYYITQTSFLDCYNEED